MFWELTSNRISRRLLRPSCQSQARGAWLFQGQPQALGLARTPPRGTEARRVQTPGGGRGRGFSSSRVRLRLRKGRGRFPGDDPLCQALERRHSAANPEGRNWGRVGPQRAWLGGGRLRGASTLSSLPRLGSEPCTQQAPTWCRLQRTPGISGHPLSGWRKLLDLGAG